MVWRRSANKVVSAASAAVLVGMTAVACLPVEQTDEPAPVAPAPMQSPAAAPLTPQCDDVKVKCAPQGGFPPALVEACKVKYEKGDPTICVQPTWPMELYNELNNSVASNTGECVPMFVTGTTTGLKLREQPNTTANVMDGANEGDEVCSLSNSGPDWAKVRFKGKVGYMSRQFLTARGAATPPKAPATAGGPTRDCSKFKDTVACKVNKSNQNCWLKVPDRVYNGMPVVDDDLTLVTTGQMACYSKPETLRVAWGPFFMHRPALMRWSPELMCYVETSNLDCP
ncbi:MAG: SH3 domain-containing protein [Proteobacteria bacterium]|nr:SH3 domain-containing protein [Pseudomonadota bacterium]